MVRIGGGLHTVVKVAVVLTTKNTCNKSEGRSVDGDSEKMKVRGTCKRAWGGLHGGMVAC